MAHKGKRVTKGKKQRKKKAKKKQPTTIVGMAYAEFGGYKKRTGLG